MHQDAYDLVRKTLDETGHDVQQAANALVQKSFEANSLDNITACVVLLHE
jgi:serine/threonine protein phosphatase PrpC